MAEARLVGRSETGMWRSQSHLVVDGFEENTCKCILRSEGCAREIAGDHPMWFEFFTGFWGDLGIYRMSEDDKQQ